MRKRILLWAAVVAMLFLSCDSESLGHVKIIVHDSSHNPVSNVNVVLSHANGTIATIGLTNGSGYYVYDYPYPQQEIYNVHVFTGDSLLNGYGLIRAIPDATVEETYTLY